MISSSRVVKAHQQTLGRLRVSVEADVDLPPAEEFQPDISEAFGEVVERAKAEAHAILEQAEQDAEALRRTAHDEGYQVGYREGQAAGRREVEALWQDVKARLEEPLRLVEASREYMNRLNDESTLALASALTLAVFSRLKLERLDVIAAYIQELVSTVDSGRVQLFLDPTWGPRLTALDEVLKDLVPQLTLSVDDSLASGSMRVETEGGGALGGPLTSLKALVEEVLG